MAEEIYHIPVLLQPSVDGLDIKPDGVYIDVTFGGGGHTREILSRMTKGRLFGFDQDQDALDNCPQDSRFVFVQSNFRYLKNFLRFHEVEAVDGLLADLGVSSHHFDEAERGFSFRFEEVELDMRMNRESGSTAATLLNTLPEERLAVIFRDYGELRDARRLAKSIVAARNLKPFDTIASLLNVIKPFFQRDREKKELAKLFQALRIEVNQEMSALEEMLTQALDVLKPGGRLVVITYHSLEDRLVKNFMKTGNFEGKSEQDFYGNFLTPFRLINNKVIVPDAEEQQQNPRSRSAKLRIAEKKG
jgi:16S rRNA (cytosine1402-N4)-methyltransferase